MDKNYLAVEAWKNFIATDIITAIQETNLYDARVSFETWIEVAVKLNVPPLIYTDYIYILTTRQNLLKELETTLSHKKEIDYRDTIIDWLDNLPLANYH